MKKNSIIYFIRMHEEAQWSVNLQFIHHGKWLLFVKKSLNSLYTSYSLLFEN